MSNATDVRPDADEQRRKMTLQEVEAMLTLVRGGWLRVELDLDSAEVPA